MVNISVPTPNGNPPSAKKQPTQVMGISEYEATRLCLMYLLHMRDGLPVIQAAADRAPDAATALMWMHKRGGHFTTCGLPGAEVPKKPVHEGWKENPKGYDWANSPKSLEAVLKAYAEGCFIGIKPLSLNMAVVDADTGDCEAAAQKVADDFNGKVLPSGTAGRFHVLLRFETPEGLDKLTDKKWSAHGGGGELRCASGQIVVYDPVAWADFLASKRFCDKTPADLLQSLGCNKPPKPAAVSRRAPAGRQKPARTQADWHARLPHLVRNGKQLEGPCPNPACEADEDGFRVRDDDGFFCRQCCPNGDAIWKAGRDAICQAVWGGPFSLPRKERQEQEGTDMSPLLYESTIEEQGHGMLSERTVSLEFLADHREDYAYRPGAGWLSWDDGEGWMQRGLPLNAVGQVVNRVCRSRNDIRTFGKKTAAQGALAFAEEPLIRTVWDESPSLLGHPRGMVTDLRTGELRQQRRGDFVTLRTTEVPADDCGRFGDVVLEIAGGDPQLYQLLRALAVSAASGRMHAQKIIIATGKPGSGKSTFFGALRRALGDYAESLDPDRLQKGRDKPHTAWLAEILPKRLVVAPEPEQGVYWDVGTVCRLAGNDGISAHFMGQNYRTWDPVMLLVMLANEPPTIPKESGGLIRRLMVLPFTADFGGTPDAWIINRYHETPKGRGEVLRWLIDYGKDFYKRADDAESPGREFPECKASRDATTAYAQVSKTAFEAWSDDYLEEYAGAFLRTRDARASYNGWAAARGYRELSDTKFGIVLGKRMSPLERERWGEDRAVGYHGWRLKPTA